METEYTPKSYYERLWDISLSWFARLLMHVSENGIYDIYLTCQSWLTGLPWALWLAACSFVRSKQLSLPVICRCWCCRGIFHFLWCIPWIKRVQILFTSSRVVLVRKYRYRTTLQHPSCPLWWPQLALCTLPHSSAVRRYHVSISSLHLQQQSVAVVFWKIALICLSSYEQLERWIRGRQSMTRFADPALAPLCPAIVVKCHWKPEIFGSEILWQIPIFNWLNFLVCMKWSILITTSRLSSWSYRYFSLLVAARSQVKSCRVNWRVSIFDTILNTLDHVVPYHTCNWNI